MSQSVARNWASFNLAYIYEDDENNERILEFLAMTMLNVNTYISPLLDLDLGHMLDGNLQTVPVSHPSVHNPKTTLPKNWTNLKWQLEEENKKVEKEKEEDEKDVGYDVRVCFTL